MNPNKRVLVVLPTYNERDNLEPILARLRSAEPSVDVLVVDDASPDGTGVIADGLAERDPAIAVLHRTAKSGLGGAYVAGFRHGIEHGYDVLVEMDADGSHAPEQLGRLLAEHDAGSDFVIGSRWVPGGSVVNWPWHRVLISRGGSGYSRIALGVSTRDLTGGFRAVSSTLVERLLEDGIESAGYCFQVDLAWRALRSGAVVTEVPITFTERERGQSKMSSGIVLEALVRVTGWGLGRIIGRNAIRTPAVAPVAR